MLPSLAEEPLGVRDPRQTPVEQVRNHEDDRPTAPRIRGRAPSIGLMGPATATGLGHLNRDLAEHELVDEWLVVDDLRYSSLSLNGLRVNRRHVPDDVTEAAVRPWLKRVDSVVWAESSRVGFLPALAKELNKQVACIPMWEWTSPTDAWLRVVDLLICPTRHTYDLLIAWKRRFGFKWRVEYFPWPVTTSRFPFRRRERCDRFIFINGHGGARARSIDANGELDCRKGCDVVVAAAALTPEIPWRIYTQTELPMRPTTNVEVLRGPADHAELYQQGDICVQPSRWEGIGLPLLECQAAGLPLVTTDMPPMNEYRPFRTIPVKEREWGYVRWGQPIRMPVLEAEALAEIARGLHGTEISAASDEARDWIYRERSWKNAAERWRSLFDDPI